MSNIWIDTKIVYEPKKQLALAYNRAMESTTAEWVLFLDQDLFICNPHWYQICLDTIKKLQSKKDSKVGWITCKCNRIACGSQRYKLKTTKDTNDVLDHIKIARHVYETNKNKITETNSMLSGFFILTNRTAWKDIGGFRQVEKSLSKIDNNYSLRLRAAGYKQYVMEDLYFYHLWKKLKKDHMKW